MIASLSTTLPPLGSGVTHQEHSLSFTRDIEAIFSEANSTSKGRTVLIIRWTRENAKDKGETKEEHKENTADWLQPRGGGGSWGWRGAVLMLQQSTQLMFLMRTPF